MRKYQEMWKEKIYFKIMRNIIAGFFKELPKANLNSGVMNKLKMEGNWEKAKGKLKEKYGNLTDDDLTYEEGKEDQLIGRLKDKLGKTKDEVRNMINDM